MQIDPNEYLNRWKNCQLATEPQKLKDLEWVTKVAVLSSTMYRVVQDTIRVPWPVIAAIHFRESGLSFQRHLHNGDPLYARTVHFPEGRPVAGKPPFLWEESAIDALSNIWRPNLWTLDKCLEFCERYNGLGYRKHGVLSPYLWGYTNQYKSGLFIADGTFNPEKIESRPGCVAILKTLEAKGVSLDFTRMGSTGPSPH